MKPRNPDSYRRVISDAQKARLRELHTVHGHAATRHRGQTRTYQSWMAMKERCDDPNHKSYASYGGRGIGYTALWVTFAQFLRDMGERPAGTTLGRIDNEGHYTPDNCKWQTFKEQARNRRGNHVLEWGGVKRTLAGWAEATGINQDVMLKRLQAGWNVGRVLTTPVRAMRRS